MNRKPPVITSSGGTRDVPKVTVMQVPADVAEEELDAGTASLTEAEPIADDFVLDDASLLSFPSKKELAKQGRARKQRAKKAARGTHRRVWLPVLIGTVLVVAVLMAVVLFTPVLAVRSVTVDGTRLATTDQIQAALAPLKNKPLTQVTEGQVQKLLAPLPQVKSASIEARPPSTLLVHVDERVPVAVLKSGDKFLLVDPEGKQLGTTTDPASAKLPLIDGGTDQIGKDTFSAITAVLAALPEDVRAQMTSAAAQSPNSVELTLGDGKKVIWGDASDMQGKADALKALLSYQPQQQEGKPALAPIHVYDVSAPGHPVVR